MAASPEPDNQINLLLSDFNTRLRDIEDRNRVVKERVLLLGQNLISSRDEMAAEIEQLKKDNAQVKRDMEKVKNLVDNLVSETNKFVRKEEVILIEKMLKDFQPLEFARMKDVGEMIEQKFNEKKAGKQTIKSEKTDKVDETEGKRILDYGNAG